MRHGFAGRRFSRTQSHRKSLIANLVISLVEHEQIVTTLPKAKDLRPVVERLITIAKKGDLAARRHLIAELQNNEVAAKKLFEVLGPRYKDRSGGYTRVLKAGFRHGDSAPVAVIEFVDRDESAKGAADKARAAAEAGNEAEAA